MQDPLWRGPFHRAPCNEGCEAGIRNETWQMRGSNSQIDGISRSLKGSPLPTVKQLLYLEEKQPQTKEMTDRHCWSHHTISDPCMGFIRVTFKYSALMDTIIPFPIIKCIKSPRGNSWNYQRSCDDSLPLHNQSVLVSNVIKESPSEATLVKTILQISSACCCVWKTCCNISLKVSISK